MKRVFLLAALITLFNCESNSAKAHRESQQASKTKTEYEVTHVSGGILLGHSVLEIKGHYYLVNEQGGEPYHLDGCECKEVN